MKALTIKQPWATLIAIGAKRIETRSWSTTYRGPLAIHASKAMPLDCRAFAYADPAGRVLNEAGIRLGGDCRDLPKGAIVAVATLAYVAMTGEALNYQHQNRQLRLPRWRTWTITPAEYPFGDFSPGRFMWFLDDVVPLRTPVSCKGARRLWTVPQAIDHGVAEQLRDATPVVLANAQTTELVDARSPTRSHHR